MDSKRFKSVCDAIHKVIKADRMEEEIFHYMTITPVTSELGQGLFDPILQKTLRFSYTSTKHYEVSFDLILDRDMGIAEPVAVFVPDICTFLTKAKPKPGEVVYLERGLRNMILGFRAEDATTNRLEIEIPCLSPKEIPSPLEDLGFINSVVTLDTAAFLRCLARAKTTTSTDDARTNLCRVCVYSKGSALTFASTDGHRLYSATCDMVLDGSLPHTTRVETALLLPPDIIRFMLNELDPTYPFQMSLTAQGYYRIEQGDITLNMRETYTGTVFPDFTMVLPNTKTKHIKFDIPIADVIECCDLVKTFPGPSQDVGLSLLGKGTNLTMSSAKIQQKSNIVRLESNNDFQVRLNASYLKDALITLFPDGVKKGKSARVHFWDSLSPVWIEGEQTDPKMLEEFALVMPLRL